MMSAIRAGPNLRKTEGPVASTPPPASSSGDLQGALMDQIRNAKLRKASVEVDMAAPPVVAEAAPSSLAQEIMGTRLKENDSKFKQVCERRGFRGTGDEAMASVFSLRTSYGCVVLSANQLWLCCSLCEPVMAVLFSLRTSYGCVVFSPNH